jgi:LuxR family maltose regulon positive regulatory protein
MDAPLPGSGSTTATDDPALFWAYVIAALKTAAPGVGEGALALLPSTQSPTEAFVVTLLNDLAAVSRDVVLVLDDYHVIDEPHIRDARRVRRRIPDRALKGLGGRAGPRSGRRQ